MTDTLSAGAQCVVCSETSDDVPLVAFSYRGSLHHICSQHLPILIHRPAELADHLPGAEDLAEGCCDH
jgi:hypothetical protein